MLDARQDARRRGLYENTINNSQDAESKCYICEWITFVVLLWTKPEGDYPA